MCREKKRRARKQSYLGRAWHRGGDNGDDQVNSRVFEVPNGPLAKLSDCQTKMYLPSWKLMVGEKNSSLTW